MLTCCTCCDVGYFAAALLTYYSIGYFAKALLAILAVTLDILPWHYLLAILAAALVILPWCYLFCCSMGHFAGWLFCCSVTYLPYLPRHYLIRRGIGFICYDRSHVTVLFVLC